MQPCQRRARSKSTGITCWLRSTRQNKAASTHRSHLSSAASRVIVASPSSTTSSCPDFRPRFQARSTTPLHRLELAFSLGISYTAAPYCSKPARESTFTTLLWLTLRWRTLRAQSPRRRRRAVLVSTVRPRARARSASRSRRSEGHSRNLGGKADVCSLVECCRTLGLGYRRG